MNTAVGTFGTAFARRSSSSRISTKSCARACPAPCVDGLEPASDGAVSCAGGAMLRGALGVTQEGLERRHYRCQHADQTDQSRSSLKGIRSWRSSTGTRWFRLATSLRSLKRHVHGCACRRGWPWRTDSSATRAHDGSTSARENRSRWPVRSRRGLSWVGFLSCAPGTEHCRGCRRGAREPALRQIYFQFHIIKRVPFFIRFDIRRFTCLGLDDCVHWQTRESMM
jgi:hypothetical protein